MAARRLLIVMLILLGISTLAAALVPQSTLNDDSTDTTGSTTSRTTTTTTAEPPVGRPLTRTIKVGPKLPAVAVAGPVCDKHKPECEPMHVGDQLTLLVYSTPAAQLEIPKLGLFQFAAPNAPAQFDLLPTAPDNLGVVFASTQRVAAKVQVLSASAARKEVKRDQRGGKGPKRPARAEPGPP